ncbi:MAG TPA: class I SAM-dependent methyltransferase [Desulfobacteraceae bacterium]|nr:class I SAM-dependent methyltransferase [Desulfobacteraceae bacterium]
MENASVSCIICGSSKRSTLLSVDGWTVMRCDRCGFGFLDPRPSSEEIARLYRSAYFTERYDGGLDTGSALFTKRISGESHRVRFIRRLVRKGMLLDIGCGYGYFLYACRQAGFSVQGLDVSDWAAGYARDTLGIDVTVSNVSAGVFKPESFDVISMWHSLEHMTDPHRALRAASLWLKPSGVLVVDVPNHSGTDARRIGKEWDGWSIPYHFWHFTPETLIRLLEVHGFRVVRRKTYHSDWVKKKLSRTMVLKPVARLIAKMFSGTSIAVAAAKR